MQQNHEIKETKAAILTGYDWQCQAYQDSAGQMLLAHILKYKPAYSNNPLVLNKVKISSINN